jgi:hypothetical protein
MVPSCYHRVPDIGHEKTERGLYFADGPLTVRLCAFLARGLDRYKQQGASIVPCEGTPTLH